MNTLTKNAVHLQVDFAWLDQVIQARIENNYSKEAAYLAFEEIAGIPPKLNGHSSGYESFIYGSKLLPEERLVLLLSIAPYLYPKVLQHFLNCLDEFNRTPHEIGGAHGRNAHFFMPTGETAMFLLAGENLQERMRFLPLFDPQSMLFEEHALEWVIQHPHEPYLTHLLQPGKELLEAFTMGRPYRPHFGPEFPAKSISTSLEWSDLVLEPSTLRQIEDIKTWIRYGEKLMSSWGMNKRIKPGYRALFYGPPGTGKTLTAALLGKESGREVYRVDLSTVVSKYIGETEKNLEKIFTKAERRNWILFFDEADSLFGKRTKVRDAHDRFANQEVSYLLQRVEDFDGVVILATNEKENIDAAFARRFQSMISFPMPKPVERHRLWLTNMPEGLPVEPGVDLHRLAERHEIAGGNIINIVRYCAMEAVKMDEPILRLRDLEEGIRREFQKIGKMIKAD